MAQRTTIPILPDAMRYGVSLGLLFILKLIVSSLGAGIVITSPWWVLFNGLTIGLTLLIPVLLYRFMVRYELQHGIAETRFSRLSLLGTLIFFFASLISSVAHYIYYQFINPGFIADTTDQLKTLLGTLSQTQTGTQGETLQEIVASIGHPTSIELAVQTIWVNLFLGIFLSMIVALIVIARKRNNTASNA